jgi:hypothetical protein
MRRTGGPALRKKARRQNAGGLEAATDFLVGAAVLQRVGEHDATAIRQGSGRDF